MAVLFFPAVLLAGFVFVLAAFPVIRCTLGTAWENRAFTTDAGLFAFFLVTRLALAAAGFTACGHRHPGVTVNRRRFQ